jgi:glycosyltransferase involved in cell wall biosynthesis
MADQSLPAVSNAALPVVKSVLHVADGEVLARVGPMFVQLTSALCAGGTRVTLVTDSAAMVARLQGTPVTCHRFAHLDGWRAWGLAEQLAARCSPPPDVVHVWDTTGLRRVQHWVWRAGVPLVVHVLSRAGLERLLRSGLHETPGVLAGSQALADEFIQRAPQAGGRCRTVVPAVAPGIRPTAERGPDRAFSVLCVGRAVPDGGLELLLEAVAQLHRGPCDLIVAVLGSGPGLDALRRRARALGVQECVALLDEPWLWEKVLPGADALVVPTCQHELSVAPLLAMALRKLVLTSRDQQAEWFVEDRTTWQFTPGSAVELAYLLTRAMEQPKQVLELTAMAADYLRAHHTIRTLVAELTSCYAQALATHTASRK